MIETLIAWCAARLIPLAIGAAAVTGYFVWDYVRIQKAETRGAERALVKVERNNEKVQAIGRRGSGNGGVPVSGSVRDPRYRLEQ